MNSFFFNITLFKWNKPGKIFDFLEQSSRFTDLEKKLPNYRTTFFYQTGSLLLYPI